MLPRSLPLLGLAALLPVLVGWTSVHQSHLLAHEDAPTFRPDQVTWPSAHQRALRAERDVGGPVVMGYMPYWRSPEWIPWETIDILAWFNVDMNPDGSLGNNHGWEGASAAEVLAAAHSVGAEVVLSATLFDPEGIGQLVRSPSARANAIDGLVNQMLAGDGDGIDIDFEGLLYEDKDDFVTFITELRAALEVAQPGSLLTLATPAIDWDSAYDYDMLAAQADYLFIMGYAFAGSWSNPRPNAPLDASDPWGSRSLRWSVQNYLTWGGEENADKFLLGLPLYGNHWLSTTGDVGASAVGGHSSPYFVSCQTTFGDHGKLWHGASVTPWTAWQDNEGWHQVWCEDVESVVSKAEMSWDEGIGGFGFWALGYELGDEDLWAGVHDLVLDWEASEGDDDDDDSAGDDDDDSAGDDDDSAGDDDDSAGDDDDSAEDDEGIQVSEGCACESLGDRSSGQTPLASLLVALTTLLGHRRTRRTEA